jgi:hypothetical protein
MTRHPEVGALDGNAATALRQELTDIFPYRCGWFAASCEWRVIVPEAEN